MINRICLVWALFLWGFFALLANGNHHPEAALDFLTLKAVVLLAGIPWLILRGLRFVFRGY